MDLKQLVKISKALGDATRLHVFEQIASRDEISCSDVLGLESVTPATISHHLKILSEAGLIACRRRGQFVYSAANPDVIRDYTRTLAQLLSQKPRRRRKRA
jgi:ArsR family transcriptional regulator, arsenate/arsenite/antimonite-responsive transcriptional repressor